MNRLQFHSLCLSLSLFATVFCGCDVPPRPPLDRPTNVNGSDNQKQPKQEKRSSAALEAPGQAFGTDWETWNAYYLDGQQVGYSHISAKRSMEELISGGDANVQYVLEDQIRFRQGKSVFVQHLVQKSAETSRGALLSIDSTLRVGPMFHKYSGTVNEGLLAIEATNGTGLTTKRIKWKSTARGVMAVQQSLRRSPMKAGDERTLETLDPIQFSMLKVKLLCTGEVAIPLLDGTFTKSMEVTCQYMVDPENDKFVEQVLWVDDEGTILKTLRSADGLVSYATDKESALGGATKPKDMVRSTAIALTGKFDRPSEAIRTAFVVSPSRIAKRDKVAIEIPALPGQSVRMTEDGLFQVLVTATDRIPSGFVKSKLVPDKSDLAPTKFIDFGAKRISQIAATAGTRDNVTEKEVALELCRVAGEWMQEQPSAGLSPASSIADLAVGECYEYATLLTALLRAKEIPCRLVAGFVFVPGEDQRMAFHIWNIAHVDGKWIALDAMTGAEAAQDRIGLATTTLANGNEYDAFKPIMNAIGKIEFEVRAVRYD